MPSYEHNIQYFMYISPLSGTDDFNIIADIRQNASGRDNLFFDGYKFTKNGKGVNRQAWQCCKQSSEHCKSTVCTMHVNGVVMMKVPKTEHSHQPDPRL